MLKSISTALKEKLSKPEWGGIETTTTTEITTSTTEPRITTVKTTVTTDSFSEADLRDDQEIERVLLELSIREEREKSALVNTDADTGENQEDSSTTAAVSKPQLSPIIVTVPVAVTAVTAGASPPLRSPSERARQGFKRILETFTRKESITTTTIQERPDGGEIAVESEESTYVATFSAPREIRVDPTIIPNVVPRLAIPTSPASAASPASPTSPLSSTPPTSPASPLLSSSPPSSPPSNPPPIPESFRDHGYPRTINHKFVKEQSHRQNIHGLKHALSASISKSEASQESKKLFEGGILTSANHKKWYHANLPINWVQKISSEYRFGNYVISNRETGTKAWEDMPIYVRIGMHLLFATMLDRKLLQTHKIHHLFSAESVKQGKHFDASESVAQIEHFIKTYKLDLSELLQPDLKQYKSFNEFFYRKLRPDARPIHFVDNPNIIVSSADCRLCVFESISAATQVWIKGKLFSIKELLKDEILASKYEGGSIALFRLAPQDYHRFHSPVTGTIVKEPFKIAGTYYTVNPMAVNSDINVFTENVRQVTLIDLEQEEGKDEDEGSNNSNSTNTGGRNAQFDQCVFVSIGALLVGSVQLTGAKEPGNRVRKGDELGFFAYGGSTCILLFKAGAVQFDQDLVASSLKGIETLVRMGECIGERK